MASLATVLNQRFRAGGRLPEFHGDPAHFDEVGDVKAWLRTLELIFDAKGLNAEERFLHTLPLLAKSALKVFWYARHQSYAHFFDMSILRFSDNTKLDRRRKRFKRTFGSHVNLLSLY